VPARNQAGFGSAHALAAVVPPLCRRRASGRSRSWPPSRSCGSPQRRWYALPAARIPTNYVLRALGRGLIRIDLIPQAGLGEWCLGAAALFLEGEDAQRLVEGSAGGVGVASMTHEWKQGNYVSAVADAVGLVPAVGDTLDLLRFAFEPSSAY
jgi:hypothetical protein